MALTEAQRKLLEALRETAIELGERGKVLTGLIGELSACQKVECLKWEPSDGYDAKTGDLRVQIKTARSPSSGETMAWFKRKKGYLFDIAMYVELDTSFKTMSIWHMAASEVEALEDTETSSWGLRIKRFREQGESL